MAAFSSTKDLIDAYNNGLDGNKFDERKTDEILASMPKPLFSQAADSTIKDSGKGKLALPYKLVQEFDAMFGADENQLTGDCTSHGTRNATTISVVCDIKVRFEAEKYPGRLATEAIYGARGHGGEGMAVIFAMQYLQKKGIALRKKYGPYDLTKYNPKVGMNWGRTGTPKIVTDETKSNLIQDFALITTVEELRDSIYNGYGVANGSNIGFNAKARDKNGIVRRNGSWGHCYTNETLIFTPSGCVNIDKLSIGQEVFNHLGDLETVTSLFNREYSDEVIYIKPRSLPEFKLTSEHPLLVYRDVTEFVDFNDVETTDSGILVVKKSKKKTLVKKMLWVDAQDIKIGDWLLTPKCNFPNRKFESLKYVGINNKTVNVPKNLSEPDEDIAWMFGFYIADGNTVKNHKVCFTFNINEEYILEKLTKAFNKLGLKITFKKFDTFYRASCYSSVLARSFDEWFGHYSTARQIPEFLLTQGWNIDTVIDGIYCGDGYEIKKNGYKAMTMCSKGLLYQIRHILINKGQKPTIHKQKRGKDAYKNAKDCYTITFDKTSWSKTFEYNDYNCLPVERITRQKEKITVYNLEVSGEHTYIADGVASHNCTCFGASDDTKQRSDQGLFLYINSWGSNYVGGPLWFEQPGGSFWITEEDAQAILNQKQTYAVSNVNGFPARDIDWSFLDDVL
jgi:hypothetical protein